MINIKEFEKFASSKNFRGRIQGIVKSQLNKKINIVFTCAKGSSYNKSKNILTIGFSDSILSKLESLEDAVIAMYVFVCHEVEHVLSTNSFLFDRFINENSKGLTRATGLDPLMTEELCHYLMNVLEDGRIERISGERLAGMIAKYQYIRHLLYKGIEPILAENEDEEFSVHLSNLSSLILIYATTKKEPKDVDKLWDKRVSETYTKMKPYIDNFVACETMRNGMSDAQDIYKLLEDFIVSQIGKIDSSSFTLQNMDNPFKDVLNQGQKTKKDQGEEPVNKEKGPQSTRNAIAEYDEGSSIRNELPENLEMSKELIDEILEEIRQEISTSLQQDRVDEKVALDLMNNRKEVDDACLKKVKSKKEINKRVDFVYPTIREDRDEKFEHINMLKYRRELYSILISKCNGRLANQSSGKLNTGQLTGLISTNKSKIFYSPARKHKSNCAIYLLLDHSGSMSGSKFKNSIQSAAMLEELFKDFPIKIVGFNTDDNIKHIVYKSFDQANKKSLLNMHVNPGGGNCDAMALKLAIAELMERPEKNKILIIQNDGEPSVPLGDTMEDIDQEVKDEIKVAVKNGILPISIAFGPRINKNWFEDVYGKHNSIVCEETEIIKHLFLLLKRQSRKF